MSETVLDLAKDFTALMIIGEIDNNFAALSKEEIVKDALEDSAYEALFTIETTTSLEARGRGNQPLQPDEAHKLVNARIEHYNKPREEKTGCWGCCARPELGKSPVKRPTYIRIKMSSRPCCNWCLYALYKLCRFAFVTVWFYYVPLFVMILSNVYPLYRHWTEGAEATAAGE